jgi:Ca-activated chloride channel family protein
MAIKLANRQLQNSSTGTIFLFTDGELHESFSMTRDLIKTPLFILGVGTEQGTSLLSEDGSWLRHKDSAVHSSLHSVMLRQLATASNGAYLTANRELGRLHQDYLASLINRKTQSQQKGKAWHELYLWTLIPALLLLIGLSIKTHYFRVTHAIVPFFILFIFSCLLSWQPVIAATLGEEQALTAWQAYSKGDYIQSANVYARFEGYDARMGEGASAYRIEDYSRATTQFTRAFLMGVDDRQRANALYNLANSYFKKAQYELAQSTYEDVLRYLPDHRRALTNLDFVKSLITTLANDPFAASLAAKRAGRGPRSIYAREDTQGAGDFSLDDEPIKKEPVDNRQRDPGNKLSTQIASGQTRVQVADDQIQTTNIRQLEPVTTRQIFAARQQILKQQREQSDLWQSLLEDEAGFPAPVQQPIIAPGDLPW